VQIFSSPLSLFLFLSLSLARSLPPLLTLTQIRTKTPRQFKIVLKTWMRLREMQTAEPAVSVKAPDAVRAATTCPGRCDLSACPFQSHPRTISLPSAAFSGGKRWPHNGLGGNQHSAPIGRSQYPSFIPSPGPRQCPLCFWNASPRVI
jgi:hypothetical protein